MNSVYAAKPLLLSVLLSLFASFGWATGDTAKDEIIEDLGWMDKRHLQRQKDSIEEIISRQFGARLRGDKSDLRSLQRIIDRGLIDRNDRLKLQAMGAVMGDVFVNQHGMEWKIVEDQLGRSRAVCIKGSQDYCLYPITMLSRRMQTGLIPRVDDVYQKALSLIEDHFPKNSFDQKPKYPQNEK